MPGPDVSIICVFLYKKNIYLYFINFRKG